MENKEKLILLRDIIPIGIKEGLVILEKAKGDIDNAVISFHQEALKTIISTKQISEEIAKSHLEKHNYDIHKTLKSIEQEVLLSDKIMIDKIINSTKDQISILYRIARFIEGKYNFSSIENWESDFNFLNRQERIFYKTWNWFNYLENESYISPIIEVKEMLNTDEFKKIWGTENFNYKAENITLDKYAGQQILAWIKENLYQDK